MNTSRDITGIGHLPGLAWIKFYSASRKISFKFVSIAVSAAVEPEGYARVNQGARRAFNAAKTMAKMLKSRSIDRSVFALLMGVMPFAPNSAAVNPIITESS